MRVLLVKLASLGDVVHALPVVQDIRSAHPGATIDWLIEPTLAPLLRRVDGLGARIESAPRALVKGLWSAKARLAWRTLEQRLKSQRYDAVIDLQGTTRSAWLASRAAGRSYGAATAGRGPNTNGRRVS